MSVDVVTVMHPESALDPDEGQYEELVHRVASSATFEKSPRLRAFFLHVCRCAIEDKPGEATEQQIGIYVYGRRRGYNPNDDNIVRSQARVLRMKLEHHFAHEAADEPIIITIPKGQYLPVFLRRLREPQPLSTSEIPSPRERKIGKAGTLMIALAAALALCAVSLTYHLAQAHRSDSAASAAPVRRPPAAVLNDTAPFSANRQNVFAADANSVFISAGHTGADYVDKLGRHWQSDRYYEGGVIQPGPKHFFPPIANEGIFRTIREAASDNNMVPESERAFQYNIPVRPGVYELRLYFADPLRQPGADESEDGQNERHFQVVVNRHPVLTDFDPIADEGFAAVDTRVFKDIYPDSDGELHIEFRSDWGRAFVSAIELTPGIQGKLRPIRIAAGSRRDILDSKGVRWSADHDYVDGRTWQYQNPPEGPVVPPSMSTSATATSVIPFPWRPEATPSNCTSSKRFSAH